jgi:predicted ATPase/DNA-binding winged helix-turn-helix (wHTH) protein
MHIAKQAGLGSTGQPHRPEAPALPAVVRFGRFRLDTRRRQLYADEVLLGIGGRAIDILAILVAARGVPVSKDELLRRAWPGVTVEERNLTVQIWNLRKAFGADRDFIRTVPRCGYSLAAEVTLHAAVEEAWSDAGAARVQRHGDPAGRTNLPLPTSELIGREAQLEQLLGLVAANRLVTLTGTGGIGKTRLAIELARRLLPQFPDGIWIVELGPLSDAGLVLPTVAGVLGLAESPGCCEALAQAIASKRLLLMLDNCEHVIDAATRLAEAVLCAGAAPRVIATSREPLRAEGECVHRVPPLEVPADDPQDLADALQYSAVRLFATRMRETALTCSSAPAEVAAMAAITRHLDGIPLAIELAAARAATLGVDAVASRLHDRFGLLTGGRRTAPARHQTLWAALDWSYALLSGSERAVMRGLARFAGDFTLEAASEVAAAGQVAASEAVDCLTNLVAKSFVMSDTHGSAPRFRLLETMRAYALEKGGEGGAFGAVAPRTLEHIRAH